MSVNKKTELDATKLSKREEQQIEQNKEDFKDFLDNTTLHGARYLNKDSVFRKLFWLTCLLAACVYSMYQNVQIIRHYYQHPYSTTITTRQETNHLFPSISFCNVNSFHTGKYRKHVKMNFPNTTEEEVNADLKKVTHQLRKLHDNTLATNYSKYFDLNDEERKLVNSTRIYSFYTANTSVWSHSIGEILMPKELFSCMYQMKECNETFFEPFDEVHYGKCYTFKPTRRNLASIETNPGLKMLMNIGSDWYIDNGYNPYKGLLISIHAHNAVPALDKTGIFVQPGVFTSCKIKRKNFISLGHPYLSNCSEKRLRGQLQHFAYRRSLCHYECSLKLITDSCKCTIETGNQTLFPYCLQPNQTQCVSTLLKSYRDQIPECFSSCPESCDYSEYDTKISTASLNLLSLVKDTERLCKTDKYKNKTAICEEIHSKTMQEKIGYFRESVVSLDIHFTDDLYEEVRQIPVYEDFTLISNIGGNLGLFLGTSILTVIEMVEFVAIALWRSTTRRKTRRLQHQSDEEVEE